MAGFQSKCVRIITFNLVIAERRNVIFFARTNVIDIFYVNLH